MQRIAVKCLLFLLAGLLSQSLLVRDATSAECGDVYRGARVGPPPEWTFWADGSACFVRWAIESPEQQEKLLQQCQNTPSARFIHFEAAKGGGQGICIFKVLDDQAVEPAESASVLPVVKDPPPVPPNAPPAEELSPEQALEKLEAMVRSRNEECLARERADDPFGAGSCWKLGAEAVGDFTKAHRLPGKDLKQKLAELQATWIERAGQLEGRIDLSREAGIKIEPSSLGERQEPDTQPVAVEEPAAVEETTRELVAVPAKNRGPDPKRLAATAACSSATLGSKKSCVSAPVSRGDNLYELSSNCSTGSIAAIGTTDAEGRCIRRVVSLNTGEAPLLESHAEPTVVDAIAYDAHHVQCYSRRHENISCDGRIDYDDAKAADKTDRPQKAAAKKQVSKKQVKKTKQASRKKNRKKAKVAAAKAQTKPVKIRKAKRKSETALKVTTNYAGKPKPDGQTKPTVRCLLFSKLC
jgi:hypothetical protein